MAGSVSELIELVDQLRDRGVTYVKARLGEVELECNLPPRGMAELPVSQTERDRMLSDPKVPQEIKERIAQEDEEDLYGAT